MKVFLLILSLNVWHCYCQKDICKSVNKADGCLQKLLLIGDPKFVYPENKADMNKHCRTISSRQKCIFDYSTKCLTSLPQKAITIMTNGIAKTSKAFCANNERKAAFISIGKCANKMKPQIDQCMVDYVENMVGTTNHEDDKLKIPFACCNFYKLKDCIMNEVNGEGDVCGESQAKEIEGLLIGYAIDTLTLLCGEYPLGSEKCVPLLPQTPKRKASQKRPKSLLPPFIAILKSHDGV